MKNKNSFLEKIEILLVSAFSFLYASPVLADDTVTLSGDGLTVKGKSGAVSGDPTGVFNQILGKGHTFIVGLTGIAAMCLVVIFIFRAVKLGASGDNPTERKKAIDGLIVIFVCAALLGGTALFTGMAYGFFGD
jgi:hypothetical protein